MVKLYLRLATVFISYTLILETIVKGFIVVVYVRSSEMVGKVS